jgi:tRNA threonylcarbamoyladenosine biosynthesis protein TsaB
VKILALDTATAATAVAVADTDGDTTLEERDDPAPGQRPRHTTRLLGLVAAALERAGWRWSDLDRLAVGVGPGTFTGLRIGVATARALAQARELPLVGVSTLQSLALGAAGHVDADGLVVPVLDARRGEVFAAAWPAVPGAGLGAWDPVLAPLAATPESLVQTLAELGCSCLAIGDGALAFKAVLERSGAVIPEDDSELHRVTAINHCRLAGAQAPQAQDGIRPQYLRLPDAELTRRVAQRT